MYKLFIKRLIDLTAAMAGFMLFFPVIAIVATALTFSLKGSPFFFQKRAGKKGKIFRIVKFKTMTDERDASGVLLPDEKRLTRVGALVRKTSIDELPQLFNVITGEMSLIGPRPLLPEYLPHYTPEQNQRHEVRPGITGLAQVKGRNQIVFSRRIKYDVFYVHKLSFFLDFKILYMTLATVLLKSSFVVNGQTVDQVDDLGLSRNLSSNHFKKK
jgi:undecaprenyl phosphate N,N'-diacetylbacillosamine 1-phosphate transferase